MPKVQLGYGKQGLRGLLICGTPKSLLEFMEPLVAFGSNFNSGEESEGILGAVLVEARL